MGERFRDVLKGFVILDFNNFSISLSLFQSIIFCASLLMDVVILLFLIDNEDQDKKEESSKKKVLTVDMVNEGIKVFFIILIKDIICL